MQANSNRYLYMYPVWSVYSKRQALYPLQPWGLLIVLRDELLALELQTLRLAIHRNNSAIGQVDHQIDGDGYLQYTYMQPWMLLSASLRRGG